MKAQQQLTLVAEDANTPEKNSGTDAHRNCKHCGKEFIPETRLQVYCSSKCVHRAHRDRKAAKKLSGTDSVNEDKQKPEKQEPIQVNKNVSQDVATAIKLLEKDRDRWERDYNKACDKIEKLEGEIKTLEKQAIQRDQDAMKKEHAQALQGLEEKKPDLIDRLAGLPEPILQALSPAIGRLTELLIPPSGTPPLAGVAGQLDDVSTGLLSWINTMPDPLKQQFFQLMANMSHQNADQLASTFNAMNALLQKGSTLNVPPYDQSMYGSN